MKKILIIEDDQIIANIYRNKFQVDGYQVETALDGEKGLEMIKTFQPDIVQLDLMLPKINGVELLKKLRSQPETKTLPVVVLSNSYLSNMVQEAWKAGATKCMSKSDCNPKQMLEMISQVLAATPAGGAAAAPPSNAAPAPAPPPAPAPYYYPVPSAPMPPPPGAQYYYPPPPPQQAPPRHVADAHADAAFQADLRQMFIDSSPQALATLRVHLQNLFKADNDTTRYSCLNELYRRTRSLSSNAGVAGAVRIAKIGAALEALFKELSDKPQTVTPSVLRTIAHTIDFLGVLIPTVSRGEAAQSAPPNILVVDDEAISRRAVVYALEKAGLKCLSLEDPMGALAMLSENRFDLIFLDVDMPGMDGFELCQKVRALPNQQKTPVIFVTSLSDFENRAKSTLSGGNDLIAKPFIFMELAVKALTFVLKGQIQNQGDAPSPGSG
jgi:DNA-binding response OmpR family regulator/HPt (histidine-containing phosphotransfer) domain-containing protein